MKQTPSPLPACPPLSKRRPVLWDAGRSLVAGRVPVGPVGNALATEVAGGPGLPSWKDALEGERGKEEGFRLVGEGWGFPGHSGENMKWARAEGG